MKYGPIGNKPNVSRTRFTSLKPSLKIDSRGYPSIAYIQSKLGNNELHFSYWDGLKWSFKNNPMVSIVDEYMVNSSNILVLDDYENPVLAFSKRTSTGSRLSLATYENAWNFITNDVDYEVGWLGLTKQSRNVDFSSSSSKSSESIDSNSSSSYSSRSSDTSSSLSGISSFSSKSNSSQMFSTNSSSSKSSGSSIYESFESNSSESFSTLSSDSSSSYSSSSSTSSSSISTEIRSSSSSSSESVGGISESTFSSDSSSSSSSSSTIINKSSSSSNTSSSSTSKSNSSSVSSRSSRSTESTSSSSATSSSSISSDSSSSSTVSSFSSSSYSSVSSSSTDSTSSSLTSMSSESSLEYSTSSSSSSLFSKSSESTSSYDDANYFVTVYDKTNSMFHIYSVTETTWRLMGSISASVSNYATIKSSACGVKVGIAFVDSSIKYNFFSLRDEQWSFGGFNTLTPSLSYGGIIDMDLCGFNAEDEGRLSVGWISNDLTTSYVSGAICSDDGDIWATDSSDYVIESSNIDVVTSSDYTINSYKKIGVSLDSDLTNIIVIGTSSKLFSLNILSTWIKKLVDIEGISNGILASSINTQFLDDVKIVLSADSGDIYYFEPTSDSDFDIVSPDMIVMTQLDAIHTPFAQGVISGTSIAGLSNNDIASVLSDTENPVMVTVNKNSSIIKTADLNSDEVLLSRDIQGSTQISSIDINQMDGKILVTDPLNNKVSIYPQSPQIQIEEVNEFKSFNKYGTLNRPLDAKFDYCAGKIWIADTDNNRVLKVNPLSKKVDLEILDSIIYPYAIVPNLNDGGVFVKGYVNYGLTRDVVSYFNKNGLELARFEYGTEPFTNSSSSTSSDSSSSSSYRLDMPSVNTITYDHTRSRLWWVGASKIFMADTRNHQIITYNLGQNSFSSAESVKVDLSSGNAFVVVTSYHGHRFLIQISRDCNSILATAYIEDA